jgi:hypothetical protein
VSPRRTSGAFVEASPHLASEEIERILCNEIDLIDTRSPLKAHSGNRWSPTSANAFRSFCSSVTNCGRMIERQGFLRVSAKKSHDLPYSEATDPHTSYGFQRINYILASRV